MNRTFVFGVLALVFGMSMHPFTAFSQGIEILSCKMRYSSEAFPLDSLRATKGYLSSCADKLAKAKQCFEKADRVTVDLQRISKNFTVRMEQGGVGTGNIWNRYLSLKQSTLQNQERIGLLIRDFKDIPTDEARITQQMSNLHTRFAADIDALNSVYNAESQLLWALDELQVELESAGLTDGMKLQANDGSACDQKEFSPTATKVEKLPRQMYSDSVILKDSITKNRQAREALVQYAFFYFKMALETAYKNAIIGGLSDLGGKLDAVLQAKSIGAEFEAWVTYAATENDRNYLESVHLQYTKPLALAVLDQKTAQSFLDRIRVVRDAYPDVAAPYVARLESLIKFFGDKAVRIEKKGWNGYLSSQRSWADRYVTNPAQVSKECVAAMSEYLKSYSAVESFDVFQQAEEAYRSANTICRRK